MLRRQFVDNLRLLDLGQMTYVREDHDPGTENRWGEPCRVRLAGVTRS